MDWFEMRVGFHSDEKVLALRQAVKNREADAFVSRIYAHCYLQEQARFAAARAPAILERAAEWRGKTGALVSALIECGFIDRDGDDLIVHGVEARIARMHVFRERAAARKERWNKKQSERAEEPAAERVPNAPRTQPERVPNGVQTGPTDRQDRQEDQKEALAPSAARSELPLGSKASLPPNAPPFARWLAENYPDVRDPQRFAAAQAAANPAVDLQAEALKALAWEVANPQRKKRSHGPFLSRWFARAQDRGGASPLPPLPAPRKLQVLT